MVWQTIKMGINRLKKGFAGHSESLGVFRITDADGRSLGGVQVFYRIMDGDWYPCRESLSGGNVSRSVSDGINFVQASSVFHQIGESVSWKFTKQGFVDKAVTLGSDGHSAEKGSWDVVLFREGFDKVDCGKSS